MIVKAEELSNVCKKCGNIAFEAHMENHAAAATHTYGLFSSFPESWLAIFATNVQEGCCTTYTNVNVH